MGERFSFRERWEIQPGDTPETLQRRVMEQAEWKLLPQATQMISEEIRREKDQ